MCKFPTLRKMPFSSQVTKATISLFRPRKLQTRFQSSISSADSNKLKNDAQAKLLKTNPPSLSVLPTRLLIRSMLITSVLSSPRLLNISLPLLTRMAQSTSALLNPDKNPLLGAAIRVLFYNHFCAGRNDAEVRSTVDTMKAMGFKGVILGYAKETIVNPEIRDGEFAGPGSNKFNVNAIHTWRDGNLRTLLMIGGGDFLAIKFTGAGPEVAEALATGRPPPPKLWQSILEICDGAAEQGTRVWIDAEQQILQPTIDAWTTNLMRRYNRNGRGHIYTTFQAYLKSTPTRIKEHLELAKKEDWVLGIKLVRGAYIASEPRHLIHDTKADTDEAYNMIARSLLKRSFLDIQRYNFPQVRLFLASHNLYSVEKAYSIHRSRILAGKPTIKLEFGQLQGMADEVSCGLLKLCQKECFERELTDWDRKMASAISPKTYKCLAWGSMQECMLFLVRRAVENRGCMDRTNDWVIGLRKEVWRRFRVAMRIERALGE